MKKIVIISGSLRRESLNLRLARVWAESFKSLGLEAEIVPSEDLNVLLFNEDEKEKNFPSSLRGLAEKIQNALGVLVCTPEYNGGISPVIKNLIDWTSTLSPHPWKGKPVLLSGTSPGALGAVAGLLHTRNPLDRLGAYVYPQSYGVALGHQELSEGVLQLKDPKKQATLSTLAKEFATYSSKL